MKPETERNSHRVDVLMPLHNAASFLADSLESLNRQTYSDWRLVAVLDRCSDSTETIVRATIPPHKLMLLNGGPGISAALNKGIRASDADLIARFDGDDLMIETRLDVQIAEFRRRPKLAALGTFSEVFESDGAVLGIRELPTGIAAVRRALAFRNVIVHPSVMFRRLPILSVGGYNEDIRAVEDYELWLRLALVHEIDNLPSVQVRYRVHQGQNSRKALGREEMACVMRAKRSFVVDEGLARRALVEAHGLVWRASRTPTFNRLRRQLSPSASRGVRGL